MLEGIVEIIVEEIVAVVGGCALFFSWHLVLNYLRNKDKLAAREFVRWLRSHWQACGYNLTGNVSGRCSECGAAVKETEGAQS